MVALLKYFLGKKFVLVSLFDSYNMPKLKQNDVFLVIQRLALFIFSCTQWFLWNWLQSKRIMSTTTL